MRNRNIEKKINETFDSTNGMQRAAAPAFLAAKVLAAIERGNEEDSAWTKIAAFISRPSIAFAGLLLIILVNVSIFFLKKNEWNTYNNVQGNAGLKDEFVTTTISIFDIENPEQP